MKYIIEQAIKLVKQRTDNLLSSRLGETHHCTSQSSEFSDT